ncbi:MAG TPA: hypothetical protein VGN97_12180 [Mesorhizobium sp.]|nr:hypothetical protein [Mesorhizobium sp.]
MSLSDHAVSLAKEHARYLYEDLLLAVHRPAERDYHLELARRCFREIAPALGINIPPADPEREHVDSAVLALGDGHAAPARAA